MDFKLVAPDADRRKLVAYLDANPEWSRLASTGGTFLFYRHSSFRADQRIEIPADDNPVFAQEDRRTCATAAHIINAVALGMPTSATPNAVAKEALRRLAAHTDVPATATGQETAR
ncbi:hypothetical protein [Nonomuraea candida]|uniref:hypothetical protein n=1 Tax=Nonomuraea candida TaxID=359159 RepID=UPI0005BC0550|nr:hypothetical protein [Nonomuraea candida]